jgi:hypothetical protein
MDLPNVVVIWLDSTFKGDDYEGMKKEFNEGIASASPTSADPIDDLICHNTKHDLITNGAPVITVQTSDEAMKEIEKNSTAKIFFISSGSLGQEIVPRITSKYHHINSFYIFCFKIINHIHWASDYASHLQMFDHQIDLLVRLMRDIAKYFIEQGKTHLSFNQPRDALKYFQHAWNLETQANIRDKMKPNTKSTEKPHVQHDYRVHLDLLDGDNGLIHQAEQAFDTQ